MRLTEPAYSIAAVGLALIASAAAIPVLAFEPYPEFSVVQPLQQARYDPTHVDRNLSHLNTIQEITDAIRDVQKATQY